MTALSNKSINKLGNTVIVIDHNLNVVKSSDWVIDMGPEGGAAGGMVIAEGTPEQVAAIDTGRFLRTHHATPPRRCEATILRWRFIYSGDGWQQRWLVAGGDKNLNWITEIASGDLRAAGTGE